MKTWTARRWVVNEIGRVHLQFIHVEAHDWPDAEAICRKYGWELDGLLIQAIEAPEMVEFCSKAIATRDRDWLEGGRRRIVQWD